MHADCKGNEEEGRIVSFKVYLFFGSGGYMRRVMYKEVD